MERQREIKPFTNITLWIILVGGIVITSGFASSLFLAQNEVTTETDRKVQRDIDYLQAFIDGNLQRIEDAAFSLSSIVFGGTISNEDGNMRIEIKDKDLLSRPSPAECYDKMEKFMHANPVICGIAIEFEPYVYPEVKSKYGFTPYVTNVSGSFERLDLGEITNSFEWEWYTEPVRLRTGHWNAPFKDSSIGHVIACYSVPIMAGDKMFAVVAVDIDTEAFSEKSAEISPYPGAMVSMLDASFNFISHPDKSLLMKNVSELENITYYTSDDSLKIMMEEGNGGKYAVNTAAGRQVFYFAPVRRTGWTITIQCPEDEVYGGVFRMKRSTTLIAVLSIILLSMILLNLFRRFQKVSMTEAGIEKELNVASGIQSGMLPKTMENYGQGDHLDVFGFQKPAKSVGGDLYDYFIRDGKFFFCMGDVSGKGVPASLYMVVVLALFRNIARKECDPAKIATELNYSLSNTNNYSMFCTMFFGVLDLSSGELDYCNAGHNKPILCKQKDFSASYVNVKPNMALGIMEEFPYVGEHLSLAVNDAIFLYTDGLTEAENKDKTLFGDDATLKAVEDSFKNTFEKFEEYVDSVYVTLKEHTGDAVQNDDITMLMIKYLEQPGKQ